MHLNISVVFQAPSPEVKIKWVSEIKRLLFQQFEHLKGKHHYL